MYITTHNATPISSVPISFDNDCTATLRAVCRWRFLQSRHNKKNSIFQRRTRPLSELPAHQAFRLHTRLAVGFGRKVALRALSPIHPIIGFPDVFTHILQVVRQAPSATPKGAIKRYQAKFILSNPTVYTMSGPKTTATIAINFKRMFRLGPEVSLKGSPTVSPTTAAL